MIHPKHLFQLFVNAGQAWSDDHAQSMGAAIAYYTMFSIAPLLVIVIAVAGAVFGRDAAQGMIVAQLAGLIGVRQANLVQGLLAAASDTGQGLIAGLISIGVMLVGATTVLAELQSALDRIWHVPTAHKSGIRATLRARLLSVGLILGIIFLLMVLPAVSAAAAAFGTLATQVVPSAQALLRLLRLLNLAVSLGLSTLLFGMIFKLMPSVPIAWRDVWVGAFTTAILFEVGKFLIGLYIASKSRMTEAFAAAGSLVVLLVWVYYAAQIFLLGAEFTKVYANDQGSRAAGRAMDRTAGTAAAGTTRDAPRPRTAGVMLTETAWSVAHNAAPRDPAIRSPAQPAARAARKSALPGLLTEVAALALVSIAGRLIYKRRHKMQKLGWAAR